MDAPLTLETGRSTPDRSLTLGREDIVDAYGCTPAALTSRDVLAGVFAQIIADLRLHVVDEHWHTFGPPGGITGIALLAESHLTVHTFPESGTATFNLYCCRRRPDWPWTIQLRHALGATDVEVRSLARG